MAYQGPERRRHRLMVTRNTEYHLRDNTCVAVRDPDSGEWLEQHQAVGEQLLGGIEFRTDGSCNLSQGDVDVGQQACFGNDMMTSPVKSLLRPPREALGHYLPNRTSH